MADFGHIAIVAAMVVAAYAAIAAPLGVRLRAPELLASAYNAVLGVAILMSAASFALLLAFLSNDFSIRYVAEHSSREMPLSLVAAAFYGGQAGSLLYWGWTLSIFSAIVAYQQRRATDRHLMAYVHMTLMVVMAFFGLVLGFVASPFEKLAVVPANGQGLNPLLYDMGMLYHPPMLLAGYMSWTIPFAFAVVALATGRLDASWIRTTRKYALVAWGILGIGNMLGAWWAYRVLGWGGYWGWDPVENSAIMPWLIGTAFIHSIMIQERRGMLKVWNMALVMATFCLAVQGTFIVRSGIISSVHSFAQSSIGPYFFAFLAVVVIGAVTALLARLPLLRDTAQFEGLMSRESGFLLNNVLLVGIAFATYWGTIFPVLSEALRGVKATVGPPFYQQVNGPLLLALLLLMAIGPLLPWRKATTQQLRRTFVVPLAIAGVATLGLGLLGLRDVAAIVALGAAIFASATVFSEYWRGIHARMR